MKKSFLSFLVLSLATFISVAGPLPQNVPPIDPFELLNNMDPKDFDQLMEDISKMSPEQLKYYEDLGKQMFESSGYNLDEIEQSMKNPQAPRPVPQQVPAQKPASAKQPATKKEDSSVDKRQVDKITKIIRTLSDALASIRQKASYEESVATLLFPFEHQLNLLTAYINRMTFEKHLKYLEEKDFAPLKTKLTTLAATLEELDANLIVPEFVASKPMVTRTRKRQIEQATHVMGQVKTVLNDSFTTQTLLTDIENLFKKYDTEALNLKKQIEDQQKKASEQVKKLPTTNTGIFPTIPKYSQSAAPAGHGSTGGGRAGSSYHPSSGGGSSSYSPSLPTKPGSLPQPPSPTSSRTAEAGAPKKAASSKDAKDGDKGSSSESKAKEGEPAEIPLTLEERVTKSQKDLRALNAKIGANKDKFLQIVDNLKNNVTPSKDSIDLLEQEMHPLKKIKDELGKIITDAEKKDLKAAKQMKKIFKDFMTDQLPELTHVMQAFKAIDIKSLTRPFSQEVDDAVTLIKQSTDLMDKIISGLTSRSL